MQSLVTALRLFFFVRMPWLIAVGCGYGFLSLRDGTRLNMPPLDGPAWTQLWMRWDSGWYLRIVRDGYQASSCLTPQDPCQQASIAFFPAYPAALWLLQKLGLSLSVASFLFNAVCLILALCALYRLAERFAQDEQFSRRALWAMLAFPTTVFFSAGYAEALYAALSLWGVVLLLEGKAIISTPLLALGTVTRPHGLLLVLCMALGQLHRRQWRNAATLMLGASMVFGTYCLWQYVSFDDPFASFHARRAWGVMGGWASLQGYWQKTLSSGWASTGALDFSIALLTLVAGAYTLRRFGLDLAAYTFALVLLPLVNGQIWGMSRGALGAFPLFLCLASWGKSPFWEKFMLMFGGALAFINALLFIHGHWVS